jgi:transcriptional regulator with XRE-family HTH domain
MSAIDSRSVLWASVQKLMQHHWKGENLNRLAREAKIGPGSVTRIKQQRTSVGIELIDAIAAVFGVEAWQLLVPTFDPASPPTLAPMTAAERDFYNRVLSAARSLKDPKAV